METAGIALTAGTAAQLIVDAAAFVTLGADDVQTAGGENLFLVLFDFFLEFVLYLFNLLRGFVAFQDLFQPHVDVAAQLNVGTAPAILVAMVTAPGTPACATIAASRS